MKEDYAAKMALKTDAALREYVTGHYQYREEAVLAAFDELRNRGQPAAEEEALRPGLEVAAAARSQEEATARTENAAAITSELASDEVADGPELYSPMLIILFSVFFSPLAGGVLLGLNLARLKRWRAMIGVLVFTLSYMLLTRFALQWALPRYGLRTIAWLGPLLNLPAIFFYTSWLWPRLIGRIPFQSRSWLKPLIICVLLAVGQIWLTIQRQPPEVRQQLEKLMPR